MAQIEIDPILRAKLLTGRFQPAVLNWNRLEGRPRAEDFDRSLRAEIRDPLWMLCRQWQFGEFQGEDAGSATAAKVQVRSARLSGFAAAAQTQAVPYDDRLPLETRVEREAVPLDLMTRARLGRHWLKLLRPVGDFNARYLPRFGFLEPAGDHEIAQLHSDRRAWQTFEALKGRSLDGGRLLAAMRFDPDEHAAWLTGAVQNAATRDKILKAAEAFQSWFERAYSQPEAAEPSAWADSYLEYQFTCTAPSHPPGSPTTILAAEEYHHGSLDWYSFDLDSERDVQDVTGEGTPPRPELEEARTYLPTPVEFPGMPNVRWWEFEDRKTDFGSIQPSTSDLATLILAEFGLVFGSDWSLIPYRLRVGTLSEPVGIVVTDVFGVRTLVRATEHATGSAGSQWEMFVLKNRRGENNDRRLLLPPALGNLQESAPLEKLILTRDEMANMVWGIEQVIPSLAGGGVDGYETATALERYFLEQNPPPPVERIDTGAAIQYRLGTQVSENWIPLIPVHIPGSNREIRLQRAAMPRLSVRPPVPVEPRGALLRPGLDETPKQPLFIHEEEVLRAGVMVTRTFQRARWWDGRIYTWLGRRKQTGRGQGSSGLEFDEIVPLE